jgi:hypothetical protein
MLQFELINMFLTTTYPFVDGTILQLMSIYGWYYFALTKIDNDKFSSWNTLHNSIAQIMTYILLQWYNCMY